MPFWTHQGDSPLQFGYKEQLHRMKCYPLFLEHIITQPHDSPLQ